MPNKLMLTAGSPRATTCRRIATKSLLLLSLSLLLATPGFTQQTSWIQTGLPINFATMTLHVQGQPMNVNLIVVSLYPMNTPPPWPVGLWLYTYVQADPGQGTDKNTWGQGQWCHWWFNEVAQAEQHNLRQVPFPYLEVNLSASAVKIQTDEGTLVYPAGSVTCWEALNDYPAP
jgi:hypothetical protein